MNVSILVQHEIDFYLEFYYFEYEGEMVPMCNIIFDDEHKEVFLSSLTSAAYRAERDFEKTEKDTTMQ